MVSRRFMMADVRTRSIKLLVFSIFSIRTGLAGPLFDGRKEGTRTSLCFHRTLPTEATAASYKWMERFFGFTADTDADRRTSGHLLDADGALTHETYTYAEP